MLQSWRGEVVPLPRPPHNCWARLHKEERPEPADCGHRATLCCFLPGQSPIRCLEWESLVSDFHARKGAGVSNVMILPIIGSVCACPPPEVGGIPVRSLPHHPGQQVDQEGAQISRRPCPARAWVGINVIASQGEINIRYHHFMKYDIRGSTSNVRVAWKMDTCW